MKFKLEREPILNCTRAPIVNAKKMWFPNKLNSRNKQGTKPITIK